MRGFKAYVRILFWAAFLLFVFNRFSLRPLVLESDLPEFLHIAVLSFPNLAEAILGMTVVTGIVFRLRDSLAAAMKDVMLYLLAALATLIYVVSQELGYHHLGGNNTYDVFDLLASILGVVLMFALFCFFGFQATESE